MFFIRNLLLCGAATAAAGVSAASVEIDADGMTKSVSAKAHARQQLMETEKDLKWKQAVLNGEADKLSAKQRKEGSLVQTASKKSKHTRSDDADEGDADAGATDETPTAADCALDADETNMVPEEAGKSSECPVVPVNTTYLCTTYPVAVTEVDEDLEGEGQARARCEGGNELGDDYHYHYSAAKDVCGGKFGGCDCCRTWMDDAMQTAVKTQLDHAVADHGECHDPPHFDKDGVAHESKKNTKAHCQADLHYDSDGNVATDYQWTWNEGKGTAGAKCGKDADCDCCRRHKHGMCVGGPSGFPPGSPNNVFETDKEKCEYGNKLGDGFVYTYNAHKGTKTAKCGKDATCDCCRQPETLFDDWGVAKNATSNSTAGGGHTRKAGKSKYKKKSKEETYSAADPRHYLSNTQLIYLFLLCGCCTCFAFIGVGGFMYYRSKQVDKMIAQNNMNPQESQPIMGVNGNYEGAGAGDGTGAGGVVGADGAQYTSAEWREWNEQQVKNA